MESEWAENILTYGLANVGATLCAPWLFDPNVILTNADHIWETGLGTLYHLPDTTHQDYQVGSLFGVPHTYFPYGIPLG